MQTNEILITPELANEFLLSNKGNRKIRPYYVTYLAKQMKSGLWQEQTGDTIKINRSGDLIDGQHRLLALIKAGMSIKFLIAYEVDNMAFDVIDQGLSRSSEDALKAFGATNTRRIGRLIRNADIIQRIGYYRVPNSAEVLSVREIGVIFLEQKDSIYETIHFAHKIYEKGLYIIPEIFILTFHYLLKNKYQKEIEVFLISLCTGLGINEPHSPVNMLRTRFLVENKSLKKTPRTIMMALFIKAWNNYILGKSIKSLKINEGEEYQTLIS